VEPQMHTDGHGWEMHFSNPCESVYLWFQSRCSSPSLATQVASPVGHVWEPRRLGEAGIKM